MRKLIPLVCGVSLLMLGCHLSMKGLDQAQLPGAESHPAPDIMVPNGFRAVRVVQGLDYPSSMTWDADGRMYILESGTVPVPTTKRRILRVVKEHLEEIPLTGPDAPTGVSAVGLTFHDGWLYFSHEQKDGSFGISRVRPDGGVVEAVVRGMAAQGDHDVNYLVFDRDGNLFFGIGSATNSGVVSSHDPVNAKWLAKLPAARDIPCRDIVLTGQTFTDDNATTPAAGDKATTGAYQKYGSSDARSIKGEAMCTGAIYMLRPGGPAPELVAWGFRNPVALAVGGPLGELFVGMHGADIRGTRPVLDDPDAIYYVRAGAWYGWPDYSAALEPITDARYQPPQQYMAEGHTRVEPVIDLGASGLRPPDPQMLVVATEPHAALGGMTFVPHMGPFAARFGGALLISEMGDFKPTTDAVNPNVHTGFQIEAVNIETRKRQLFARNRGAGAALPASTLDLQEAFERPVDVKVGPDGNVYVLDFGVFRSTATAANVMPKTGKVFRIEPIPAP